MNIKTLLTLSLLVASFNAQSAVTACPSGWAKSADGLTCVLETKTTQIPNQVSNTTKPVCISGFTYSSTSMKCEKNTIASQFTANKLYNKTGDLRFGPNPQEEDKCLNVAGIQSFQPANSYLSSIGNCSCNSGFQYNGLSGDSASCKKCFDQVTFYKYDGSPKDGQIITDSWIHYTCPNDGVIVGINSYAIFGSPVSFDGGASFGSSGFKNQKTISIMKMMTPPTVACSSTCLDSKVYFNTNPENLPLTHFTRFRREDGTFFYHSSWYTNIDPSLIYTASTCNGQDVHIGGQYIGVSGVVEYVFCLRKS